MSSLIQPNGMPGRSFRSKPNAAQMEDRGLRNAAVRRNRKTFDAVRRAASQALASGTITVREQIKAWEKAGRDEAAANLADYSAITASRRMKTAQAA